MLGKAYHYLDLWHVFFNAFVFSETWQNFRKFSLKLKWREKRSIITQKPSTFFLNRNVTNNVCASPFWYVCPDFFSFARIHIKIHNFCHDLPGWHIAQHQGGTEPRLTVVRLYIWSSDERFSFTKLFVTRFHFFQSFREFSHVCFQVIFSTVWSLCNLCFDILKPLFDTFYIVYFSYFEKLK